MCNHRTVILKIPVADKNFPVRHFIFPVHKSREFEVKVGGYTGLRKAQIALCERISCFFPVVSLLCRERDGCLALAETASENHGKASQIPLRFACQNWFGRRFYPHVRRLRGERAFRELCWGWMADTEVLRNILQVFVMTCKFSNPNLRYHTCSHTHPPMVKTGVISLCAKRPILSRFSCRFLNYDAVCLP